MSLLWIADFLFKLFDVKRLQVRTIEGYRSAIVSTLFSHGYKVGSDVNLSSLINSFYADRPVMPSFLPRWNLPLVLSGLMKWPFESKDMSRVEMKHLAYKAVFLLSLASGAWRGEIHALDHQFIRWSRNGTEVCLHPYAGFMVHVA